MQWAPIQGRHDLQRGGLPLVLQRPDGGAGRAPNVGGHVGAAWDVGCPGLLQPGSALQFQESFWGPACALQERKGSPQHSGAGAGVDPECGVDLAGEPMMSDV